MKAQLLIRTLISTTLWAQPALAGRDICNVDETFNIDVKANNNVKINTLCDQKELRPSATTFYLPEASRTSDSSSEEKESLASCLDSFKKILANRQEAGWDYTLHLEGTVNEGYADGANQDSMIDIKTVTQCNLVKIKI